MKHVFTSGEGDQNLFLEFYNSLKDFNDERLIEAYYRQMRLGMTGVHAQAIYVLALRKVMIGRFGKDFISFEGGVLDLG
ncbi:hypothetical protein [Maribacter arcticus]|uniref:hypothetical protein n=1 Tax=Maribacter arcticus TaxID=561365 RepID=UPI0030034AB6